MNTYTLTEVLPWAELKLQPIRDINKEFFLLNYFDSIAFHLKNNNSTCDIDLTKTVENWMCPSHTSSLTRGISVSVPGVLLSEQITNQRTFHNVLGVFNKVWKA